MDVDGQDVAASGASTCSLNLARFEAPAGIVRVRFAGDHWKPARDTGGDDDGMVAGAQQVDVTAVDIQEEILAQVRPGTRGHGLLTLFGGVDRLPTRITIPPW